MYACSTLFEMLIIISSFFFFLNDPAPPEIYPLPLPAALPIPPPDERFARAHRAGARCYGGARHQGNPSHEQPSSVHPCLRRYACNFRTRRRAASADRKSTRLNSSHGYISYAVFCLKKKKKDSV